MARELFWDEAIKNSRCPLSELDPSAEFQSPCSAVDGSECLLRCKEDFLLQGDHVIRCNRTKWIGRARCLEPICPSLPDAFETVGKCWRVKDYKCSVRCKKGALEGERTVQCLPSGEWNSIPKCVDNEKCPVFVSPDISFVANCSFTHENRCQIMCNNDLVLVGTNFVTCHSGTWRGIPDCVPIDSSPYKNFGIDCKDEPEVSSTLKLLGQCRYVAGMSCRVACRDPLAFMEGPNATTCLTPGTWSSTKYCVGANTYCIDPRLSPHLELAENCSGMTLGSECSVKCKNRPEIKFTIKCLSSTVWTMPGTCTCRKPEVGSNLKTIGDCSNVSIGEKCQLACESGFEMEGSRFVICQNDSQWSSMPSCREATCSPPILREPLTFAEDCSLKYPGSFCEVKCPVNGRLVGENTIECISGSRWSELPICVCDEPSLGDDVEMNTSCVAKKPGERCYLKCKSHAVLEGENYIECKIDMEWTDLPACKKLMCQKPNLPPPLVFAENCNSKMPGDQCKVKCAGEEEIVGTNKLTCVNGNQWSSFPTCTCPNPNLPSDLTTANDCIRKRPGDKCFLKCRGRSSFIGNDFIVCMNDSSWSPIPECTFCSEPKLPDNMKFEEDCSSKVIGDDCKVACINRGKLLGADVVVCMNVSAWSEFPTCSCPNPEFNENIVPDSDCSGVPPGKFCLLRCRNNLTIVGNKSIECLPSLKWTLQPKCEPKICSIPMLTEGLMFTENCSSKLEGQNCQLRCKYGGKLLHRNYITCINETFWSPLPSCTCPPFQDQNLMTLGDCSVKHAGETCNLSCEEGKILTGNSMVSCQSNGTWDYQPSCRTAICMTPKLEGTPLHFKENCSFKSPRESCKLGCNNDGVVIGTNSIECINEREWSALPLCACNEPKLENTTKTRVNCNGTTPGTACQLECTKKGTEFKSKDFIVCQNNITWDDAPVCENIICPDPILPEILVFEQDCTNRVANDKCTVKCKEGGKMLGESIIQCIEGVSWTLAPDCSCPEPELKPGLEFKNNCSQKRRTETCTLGCKGGLQLLGTTYLTCLNNTKWSPQPDCQRISCPNPSLPAFLAFNGSCVSDATGDMCRLKCKNGGKLVGNDFMSGNAFITCNDNTEWSPLPSCAKIMCPKPFLSDELLEFQENCKFIGETCRLKCKKGGKIIGNATIICGKNTSWTGFPDCSCPAPGLGAYQKAKGDCSETLPGGVCRLECIKTGTEFKGKDFIVCQNNTMWEDAPSCENIICPDPVLPEILIFEQDCTNKVANDKCTVKCKEGGKIFGKSFIQCIEGVSWTSAPDCSCPEPELKQGLEFKNNCSQKRRNETCTLGCKVGLQILGKKFLTCQNNTKWSPQPDCQRISCPNPSLPTFLALNGSCVSDANGDMCRLKCQNGGKLLGNDFMRCTDGRNWSEKPVCTCPRPAARQNVEIRERCDQKKPGDQCRVGCKPKFQIEGPNFIKCQSNGQWNQLPQCKRTECIAPNVSTVLETNENCSNKKINESCHLKCKKGGSILGAASVKCLNSGRWSRFPKCSCPVPQLSELLEAKENCSLKEPKQKCEIQCKQNYRLSGNAFITCNNNTEWSPLPACMKIVCAKPSLSDVLLEFKENCAVKYAGDSSQLKCKSNSSLIGSGDIKCLPNSTWTEMPKCGCPKLIPRGELETAENCTEKRKGETCLLKCKKNFELTSRKNRISCLDNAQWESLPTCRKKICSSSALSSEILDFIGCASKGIGETCEVKCKKRGEMIGSNKITCINETSWTSFPDCKCPVPALGNKLRATEDCKSKKRGEKCTLTCEEDYQLEGRSFIICKNDTAWDTPPSCKLKKMSKSRFERQCI
ncbi:sushi, von Willebrand factor type A, EGF and pentraxin domain-containing protein 1-like [Uloborus diversus]|uniref:sushi, von Willebrand factor type A, EGF and pentraxin domain-containing protein 1-like n=1 Tax=Uloborus diversus TaxID=327109 RepID=UPI00240983DB|nr:sushi, von Willebrand factor type A, EGF and pentraxin domain-containing protein 1-like [Uloborus diversus]